MYIRYRWTWLSSHLGAPSRQGRWWGKVHQHHQSVPGAHWSWSQRQLGQIWKPGWSGGSNVWYCVAGVDCGQEEQSLGVGVLHVGFHRYLTHRSGYLVVQIYSVQCRWGAYEHRTTLLVNLFVISNVIKVIKRFYCMAFHILKSYLFFEWTNTELKNDIPCYHSIFHFLSFLSF